MLVIGGTRQDCQFDNKKKTLTLSCNVRVRPG